MMMLRAGGMFLLALGVIWALQGAGLLNWPSGSFMLARAEWTYYGALTASIGTLLLWLSGRIRR